MHALTSLASQDAQASCANGFSRESVATGFNACMCAPVPMGVHVDLAGPAFIPALLCCLRSGWSAHRCAYPGFTSVHGLHTHTCVCVSWAEQMLVPHPTPSCAVLLHMCEIRWRRLSTSTQAHTPPTPHTVIYFLSLHFYIYTYIYIYACTEAHSVQRTCARKWFAEFLSRAGFGTGTRGS